MSHTYRLTRRPGRRTLSLTAACAMVVAMGTGGVAQADEHVIGTGTVCPPPGETVDNAFPDDDGGTHEGNINCAEQYGIVQGRDGNYNPGASVNRAQMATYVVNEVETALGESLPEGDNAFTDDDGNVHETNINKLANNAIILGIGGDEYNPAGNVSRGQMATFIANAIDYHDDQNVEEGDANSVLPSDPPNAFPDDDTNTHHLNINRLADAMIVVGTSENAYSPNNDVTRAQMATFIMHMAEFAAQNGLWAPTTAPAADNETFTDAPELVRVEAVQDDVVAYTFDETVTGQALEFEELTPGGLREYYGFRLYDSDGDVSYPFQASINDDTVLARFQDNSEVNTAALAGVQYDAVEDTTAIPNMEGDFPLQPAAVAPPETDPYSPQLLSVGNYRTDDVTGDGSVDLLVDYVFEELDDTDLATLEDGTPEEADEFYLVGSNGAEWQGQTIEEIDTDADAEQTTISVRMADDPTDVPESQLRRGYVVAEDDDATEDDGDGIVLAEPWEDTDGNTVDPDLVSVERVDADTFRYEFDEAVSDVAAELNADGFAVFDEGGTIAVADNVARSAQAADEARVVLATFDDTLPAAGAGTPVDAFIADTAVVATDSTASENAGGNRPDEAVVTLPPPGDPTELPAGVTGLPDLQSVQRDQNVVTGNYSVAYTFDESVTGEIVEVAFDLFDDNGTQFRVEGATCASAGVSCSSNGDTVTFSIDDGFGGFANEDIAAADAAGVEDDAEGGADLLPAITEAEVGVTDA